MPETNREHFFGDRLIYDTVHLLTMPTHPREECVRFKNKIEMMSPAGLRKWFDSPKDPEFPW